MNKADSSTVTTLSGKAYQIDDTTENSLANNDVLPFYDISATAKRKMTVQKFAEQLVSNRNLLDNPWFTVNQRGFTSGSAIEYTFDRWCIAYNPSLGTVSHSDGIVTINGGSSDICILAQFFNTETFNKWKGKKATCSILLSDNSIKSGTITIPSSYDNSTTYFYDDANLSLAFHVPSNDSKIWVWIGAKANKSVSFKALKFELGTVSTLSRDVAPDYETEFAKCRLASGDVYDVYANQGSINVGTPNPNLLDNPWFTVDQRGFAGTSWTTETSSGYRVDRWGATRTTGSVVNTNISFAWNGSESTFGYLWQRIENVSTLSEKLVTYSVNIEGIIYSLTGIFPAKGGTSLAKDFYVNNDKMGLTVEFTSQMNYAWVTIRNYTMNSHTVYSTKLELGTVSTLALDTTPNYAEELLKCQRYFYSFNSTGEKFSIIGDGYCTSVNNVRVVISLPTTMRTLPTISVSNMSDVVAISTVNDTGVVTAISIDHASFNRSNIGLFNITCPNSFVKGECASIYTTNNCIVGLSADL